MSEDYVRSLLNKELKDFDQDVVDIVADNIIKNNFVI